MLDQIFEDCKKQFSAALKHRKHSFRFFTLATLRLDGGCHLRTVVLRDFDPGHMNFTIFTDSRSKKVMELNQNEKTQLLFYDSTRMIQLLIQAKMREISHETLTYKTLPDANKKDYSSIQIPGTPIKGPDEVDHDFSKGYFTIIKFQSLSLEYLRLKRPNHIRAVFSSLDSWRGQFIAP